MLVLIPLEGSLSSSSTANFYCCLNVFLWTINYLFKYLLTSSLPCFLVYLLTYDTVVSLAHIGVVGTGDLKMVWGDCELTQGVNSGQEKGFGVVLCKL